MNENIFRKGKPDDYLSLCTNTNYQEFDPTDPTQVIIRDEINEFMSQLFPNRNVCQYMWEHLASTLKGSNLFVEKCFSYILLTVSHGTSYTISRKNQGKIKENQYK